MGRDRRPSELMGDVRVLGIDVGERRIGLAISDVSGTLARPLTTLVVSDTNDAIVRIVATIQQLSAEDDGLDGVVVGLPLRLDGSATHATARVTALIEALKARTTIAIATEDERLSSHEAESRLALRERDWRRRKQKLDAAAAAIILQDYLDHSL
jgi:putative Holliday junction resolvase